MTKLLGAPVSSPVCRASGASLWLRCTAFHSGPIPIENVPSGSCFALSEFKSGIGCARADTDVRETELAIISRVLPPASDHI